jgi:hypothetical protein
MRARSFVNLGVAGAAIPDGFAVACRPMLPVLPDAAGFLVGTAIELVDAEDRAAVRGGRATVGLNSGSAAAAATFSAVTFNDEANATVSSQVGGRVTSGAAGGGVGLTPGVLATGVLAGRAAAALCSSILTSSGPGGVGAGMNAGSGSACRPSSELKNFRGAPRGIGGAASGSGSQGCATAKAIASPQTTVRRRSLRTCRDLAAITGQVEVGARK